ncbi:MAG: hypothetical protein V7L23_31625 [Nostoc sp.]|uniref:hypothetical protein n=1 Tax=Nostoc sp. TaxID=1180 RepID=UPI002FF32FBE
MTISDTFARNKISTTVSKALSLSAAIAEGTKEWIVDVILTVTKDDTTTVTKTLFRVNIPYVIVGQEIVLNSAFYNFLGNSTTYSAGGVTPPLSEGSIGNLLDLNAFLAAAGDTPENS